MTRSVFPCVPPNAGVKTSRRRPCGGLSPQPLVMVQMERKMPKGMPKRTYHVVVEQDAAIRSVSPRGALSCSDMTPPECVREAVSIQGHQQALATIRPSCRSSMGLILRERNLRAIFTPEAKKTLAEAERPRKPPQGFALLPSQLRKAPEERFSVWTEDHLLRATLAAASASPSSPARRSGLSISSRRSAMSVAPRLSSAPSSLASSSSPRFSQRPNQLLDNSAAPCPSPALSEKTVKLAGLKSSSPSPRATPMSSRQGSRRNSRDTASDQFRGGSPDSVELRTHADFKCFTMGKRGLEQKCSLALWRAKSQVRELHQRMVSSMTRSFPWEVWEGCDIPHPDADKLFYRDGDEIDVQANVGPDLEVEQAKMTKTLELNNKFIKYDRELDTTKEHLQDQRLIAGLAKESGWSVLDVEEFRDTFNEHATDGAICLGSEACEQLIGKIYCDVRKEEIHDFISKYGRHTRHAGRKTVAPAQRIARKRMTIGHRGHHHAHTRLAAAATTKQDSDSEEEAQNSVLNFQEFYFAFVRWMRQAGTTEKKRCTLKRYSMRASQSRDAAMNVSAHEAPPMMHSMDSDDDSEDRATNSSQTSGSEVHSINGDDPDEDENAEDSQHVTHTLCIDGISHSEHDPSATAGFTPRASPYASAAVLPFSPGITPRGSTYPSQLAGLPTAATTPRDSNFSEHWSGLFSAGSTPHVDASPRNQFLVPSVETSPRGTYLLGAPSAESSPRGTRLSGAESPGGLPRPESANRKLLMPGFG